AQLQSADTEGVLGTLARAGRITVQRRHHVRPQLAHRIASALPCCELTPNTMAIEIPVWGIVGPTVDERTYSVPAMSCGHCEQAIKTGVSSVPGVAEVQVDLQTKRVRILGAQLDDRALRAAIEDAGYDVA